MEKNHPTEERSKIIALVAGDDSLFTSLKEAVDASGYSIMQFGNGIELSAKWTKLKLNIVAIISGSEIIDVSGISLFQTLKSKKLPDVPFFIVANHLDDNLKNLALKAGITDVFLGNAHVNALLVRVKFIVENWNSIHRNIKSPISTPYKLPLVKRLFDIAIASLALLLASPFLLLIIIAIKLESKGPVFYYSLRVGTGYKIFKFFKLRSMYTNADKRLKDLKHLNQYAAASPGESNQSTHITLCDECAQNGKKCAMLLYSDKDVWCGRQFAQSKKAADGSAFIKIKNDPRVTKVGKFIRNTSIDEVPQLINVLKGDMSIVGNRPIPIYEAEKLTTNEYAQRFMAPAGITGLWQVEKRGKKGEMSEEERLMLDNTYAQNHSFLNDIRLIFKTIPALFQQENV
jgi:lipopolysaccharide/colanic/teichoic acid biosynthesis glycosyltransferase